ncbi:MAG: Rieske (2Fe-2S) protein [Acidimicrobiales bacterium]
MGRVLGAVFVAAVAVLDRVGRAVRSRLRRRQGAPASPPVRPVLGAGSALLLLVGLAGAATAVAGFALGWPRELPGLSAALACLAPAVVLGVAGRRITDRQTVREERPAPYEHAEERARLADELAGIGSLLGRRRLLGALFGGSALGLAALALLPLRSLGPSPWPALRRTAWQRGRRLVGDDGRPLRLEGLVTGSMTTAFPEGATDGERGDSQLVVVRVREGALRLPAARVAAAPGGCIAFSKVCTHAGCSIGLYQVETQQLLCPCHQSVFDVTRGAEPVFGPATRSLPQLPLLVDTDGYLRAAGDFDRPVGPGFWSMGR